MDAVKTIFTRCPAARDYQRNVARRGRFSPAGGIPHGESRKCSPCDLSPKRRQHAANGFYFASSPPASFLSHLVLTGGLSGIAGLSLLSPIVHLISTSQTTTARGSGCSEIGQTSDIRRKRCKFCWSTGLCPGGNQLGRGDTSVGFLRNLRAAFRPINHFADFAGEASRREWLFQKSEFRLQDAMMGQRIVGVTGHEQYLHPRERTP